MVLYSSGHVYFFLLIFCLNTVYEECVSNKWAKLASAVDLQRNVVSEFGAGYYRIILSLMYSHTNNKLYL